VRRKIAIMGANEIDRTIEFVLRDQRPQALAI
jgi:hypothetical protein